MELGGPFGDLTLPSIRSSRGGGRRLDVVLFSPSPAPPPA